ncbi:MAG TPA: DinB family protein [Fimbriimonadaceae bacterium]|nr:DinB family protein [Fimbriimonadaceae bacterium]
MTGYLLPALSFTPGLVADLARRVPADRFDVRVDPTRFSPREVVAHLADWEPILRGRLETAYQTPGASVQGIDEWVRGEEVGYGRMDLEDALAVFRSERARTLAFLEGLSEDDFGRDFVHSELGRMTIREYASNMLGHDVFHLEQLSRSVT